MNFLATLAVIAITALFMMVFLLPKDHPVPTFVNGINDQYIIPLLDFRK